jgi:hypothetical protein
LCSNLFVERESPAYKRMLYRLEFADGMQHALTMTGYKEILDDHGFDVWSETTTLFTRVLAGHVPPEGDAAAEIVASDYAHPPA